jgi:hypothetical protein
VKRKISEVPHYAVQPPATSSFLGPDIPVSTLFSDTFSPYSSLSMRDEIQQPYKTADKIVVLYILIIKILERRLGDKRHRTRFPEFNLL